MNLAAYLAKLKDGHPMSEDEDHTAQKRSLSDIINGAMVKPAQKRPPTPSQITGKRG